MYNLSDLYSAQLYVAAGEPDSVTAPLPLHRNPVTKEPTKRSNQHDSQRPSSCYAALSLSRLLQTLHVMLDLTTPSQTLRLRVLVGWGSSFLLGIRASYSKYFHHVTKNYLRLGICEKSSLNLANFTNISMSALFSFKLSPSDYQHLSFLQTSVITLGPRLLSLE